VDEAKVAKFHAAILVICSLKTSYYKFTGSTLPVLLLEDLARGKHGCLPR